MKSTSIVEILEVRQFMSAGATPIAPPAGSHKLAGEVIGSAGSFHNLGNIDLNAFDGNASTYYDAATASGAWVGADWGSPQVITQIQYVPRAGFASRMIGGVFQGSNTPDFSSGVSTLATVPSLPTLNIFNTKPVNASSPFRYVRFLSAPNSYCDVAELEFDGIAPGTVSPQTFPTHVSWTTGAPSPIVRAEAVGGMVDGILYVFGGFNNQGSDTTTIPLQSRCDSYNPVTNTWTRLKDFPEPFTHSQQVIIGTEIWFIGGYIGNHPGPGTTHVWVYDTTQDNWFRGPDLPDARGAGAAAFVGTSIYYTGGMNQSRTVDENTTWAFDVTDPSAGWVRKADMPNGRNHIAGASLDGYFYAIGGQHGQVSNQAAQSEVDRYDPATNTWTKIVPLPSYAGKSHISESILTYEGRIIIVGGETGYNNPQRSIVDYDPATNTWALLGKLPAARSTALVAIVNGKLVVTTGNDPSATNTTYIGTLS